jgi:hypothetical protein
MISRRKHHALAAAASAAVRAGEPIHDDAVPETIPWYEMNFDVPINSSFRTAKNTILYYCSFAARYDLAQKK